MKKKIMFSVFLAAVIMLYGSSSIKPTGQITKAQTTMMQTGTSKETHFVPGAWKCF